MQSRARYPKGLPQYKPPAIQERSWAIFTAYCYEGRSLDEIAGIYQLSPAQASRVVEEVGGQLGHVRRQESGLLGMESAIEELGLSARIRNALHAIGCNTIEDVLRLDPALPVRGFGAKSRKELLEALARAGLQHPALEEHPVSEIRLLERSLERIQGRVDRALGAIAKEIRMVKQRLRKKSTPTSSRLEGPAR